jgi:hypothetical protein
MVPTPLGIAKQQGYPTCAEVKLDLSEYNLGTELILLSVRALDDFTEGARVTCNEKYEMSDWSAFGLFGKYRIRLFQRYVQKGKQTSGRYSNPVLRQQMFQNGDNAVRKVYGNLGGAWEMGQESE